MRRLKSSVKRDAPNWPNSRTESKRAREIIVSKSPLDEPTDENGGGLYERELRVACELARAAGATTLAYYGGPLRVEHKKGDPGDPVTQADREANEIIVEGLRKAFPGDGLLAEESVDTGRRLCHERAWMIDPLDGTKDFIAGTGDFAVQIGLAMGGESVLGVVYQPVPDVLYLAARGHGAWVVRPDVAPEQMRVSERTELTHARLAVSRSHRSPRMEWVVRALDIAEEVPRGSVGIKIGLITERQCDLYIHLSSQTKQWDTCAPEAILTEAGGLLTDLWGEPLRYNTPDVRNYNGLVAAGKAAHPSIIRKLAPLLARFGRKRVDPSSKNS